MSPSRPVPVPVAVVAELHVVPPDASLVLTGDVDLHAAEQVVLALDAVTAAAVLHLSVDLTSAEFVSLGMMGALVEAARTLSGRGGAVRLVGARSVQRRVIGLLDPPPGLVLIGDRAG